MVPVRKREQLLADAVAVAQREPPHAADLIRALAALDLRFGDDRVPRGVAVEVAQHGPHALDRRVDDSGSRDSNQRRNIDLSESNAAWNTPWPICCASTLSRSGAHSNSAHHSAKVRPPSVTGVSFNVAT